MGLSHAHILRNALVGMASQVAFGFVFAKQSLPVFEAEVFTAGKNSAPLSPKARVSVQE